MARAARSRKRHTRPAPIRATEREPAVYGRGERGRAQHRRLAAEFGRRSAELENAAPTDIGCAQCRGVLYVSELGKHNWLSFVCRIGHGFSADSLLAAKEEQLEQSLWETVEVLEEIVQLYGVFALRDQADRNTPRGNVLERRLALAQSHLGTLRGMIENEGPAPPPIGSRRSTHVSK